MYSGTSPNWTRVLLTAIVAVCIQQPCVPGFRTTQGLGPRIAVPSCVSKLCPRDCVTCDGVVQCFDVTDERGCDNRTDGLFEIIPPPSLPPPGVFLERLKLQLQRQQEKISRQAMSTEAYTTTLPTVAVSSIHTSPVATAVPVTGSPFSQLPKTHTTTASHISKQSTTLPTSPKTESELSTTAKSTPVATSQTTVKSTFPSVPYTKPFVGWLTESPRPVTPPFIPGLTDLPPTKRSFTPWFVPSTAGPDVWWQWFLGAPSVREGIPSFVSSRSLSLGSRPLLQTSLNYSKADSFPPGPPPVISHPALTQRTTTSPWLQIRPRTPFPRPPAIELPPTTLAPLWPPQPLHPGTSDVDDDQDCMKIPDIEGFCRRRYQGLFRNPHDCASFYICDWGYKHLCPCPPGTRFDVRHSICNWHSAVQC